MSDKPLFRFKIRATGIDPTGYYYVNWERAQSLSVLAHNKAEATTKALAMLGTHRRFGDWRRPGSGWTFKWDDITEELVADADAKVQELAKRLLNGGITDSLEILDRLASGELKLMGGEG